MYSLNFGFSFPTTSTKRKNNFRHFDGIELGDSLSTILKTSNT